MKPLRETEARSPLLRQARALLESAEPLPESRERMLRVRRALDQRTRGGALGRIPAAVTAGVIVLFGASAFAAVRYIAERSAVEQRAAEQARTGHARRARAPEAVPPEPVLAAEAVASAQPAASRDATARRVGLQNRPLPEARTIAANRSRARATRARPAAAKTRSAELRPTQAVQAPTAVPAASATSSAVPAAKEPALASAAQPAAPEPARIDEPVAPVAPVAPAVKDGELVHRALQALRRQDDPALAARLLAQHRQKQPSGALAEEALSLQIEAAVALEDPRALMFAREYLARYPHGRYVRVARKALAGGR